MKYYLIAGEASGDLHASNLMKALAKEDSPAEFRYWGGDLMKAVGGKLVRHYRDLAFMGFWEVVTNIWTIASSLSVCKKDIAAFRPDVLILVDYSGFNLRIAKWAKSVGLTIFYYISPQIWASRTQRVYKIKKWVDQMFVILPFETDFYRQFGMEVEFVGHPLLDALDNYPFDDRFAEKNHCTKPLIALLPGSRQQEVKIILKEMLPLIARFPDFQFVIAMAPALSPSFYEKLIVQEGLDTADILLLKNQTYDLLNNAMAALVTSGTATLETALFEVPQVVCYKGTWLTYQIARRIIKLPYISLVNLIVDRPLVTELIQNQLTTDNLEQALISLLEPGKISQLKKEYRVLRGKLGKPGASVKTARLMINYLKFLE